MLMFDICWGPENAGSKHSLKNEKNYHEVSEGKKKKKKMRRIYDIVFVVTIHQRGINLFVTREL